MKLLSIGNLRPTLGGFLLATNHNKPDLSDLKARLGMKQPPAGSAPAPQAPPAGGPSGFVPPSAPHAAAPAAPAPAAPQAPPAGAQPSFQPAAPHAAAPQVAAPPAAARKPPVAAAPRQAQAPRQQQAPVQREPLPDLNVADIGGDTSLPGSRMFSLPVLMVIGGAMVLGLLFGYIGATSGQHRQVDNARTEDAKSIRDGLRPRIEKLDGVLTAINGLHPNQVDFEAAESLADVDFSASGNLLNNSRILLGPEIVGMVMSYAADSTMLKTMLAQHKKATAEDRKELESLLNENAALVEASTFAVVFDYRDMIRRGGDASYMPKPGSLVTINSLDRDEDGKITFNYLNSDRSDKSDMQGFIPIQKGDIIKSSGDNALQRYEKRVSGLKAQATILSNYYKNIDEKLSELADRPSAPLIKLTSG